MPIRRLEEIYVPTGRIRRNIDPAGLEELIRSIQEIGLLHPPVVEEDGALLVGERRFRALQAIAERGITYHSNKKFIQPGLIMTTDIRELSSSQRLQAELEENTVRIDISWQEKAEATAALHALREAQKAEQTLPGLPPAPQTYAETAAEMRGKPLEEVTRHNVNDVRADLFVQTWLQNHPDDTSVLNAKSRAEALKLIETQIEFEHRAALGKRFLLRRPTAGHIIQLADVCTAFPDTPDGLYDVICTDPPWGRGADEWTNGGSIHRHTYTDDMHTFERIHETIAKEGFRVCKPKAHLYLFCAFQAFGGLASLFRAVGWDVWPRPLIWYRPNSGIAPRPEHGPRNTYECILFANKGDKRVMSLRNDVIVANKPHLDVRAAAKPVAAYYDLLMRSVTPGDEIVDPCCGSGPIIPAANALKCRATCYDISEEAIGIASGRIEEAYSHLEMKIQLDQARKLGVASAAPAARRA